MTWATNAWTLTMPRASTHPKHGEHGELYDYGIVCGQWPLSKATWFGVCGLDHMVTSGR